MSDEDDRPRNRPWDKGGRDRDDEDDRNDRPRRDRDRDRDDEDEDRPRRRRHEDDRARSPQSDSNGLATAGLILGVLSFCTLCFTGVPAIICSAIALGKPGGRGSAVAGLILGGLATLAGIGVGVWAAMVLPDRIRLTAGRANDSLNMKEIASAQHAQHDRTGGLSPYVHDNTGKLQTELSWRVDVLPYLEQGALHRKFDLSQPWDSPANKSLSNTPLKVYTTTYESGEPSVNTPYRVFVGGGALFDKDGSPVSLTRVLDGTSNTIMTVHATELVPWAAPRELTYNPDGPLPKLGHPLQPGGFFVSMADGSVRFVSNKVSEQTLRAAITRAGGEPLGADWGGDDW
jgi:hypothetical protein